MIQRLTEVWTATNDEDRRIVEGNQRGVNTPAYEPGPIRPYTKPGYRFCRWYCDTMAKVYPPATMAAE